MITHLDNGTFNDAIKEGTVLVDFWAPWCGPCKMLGPVLEELDGDLAGSYPIYKLNVDDNTQIAGQYAVSTIPTMIIFKNGEEQERIVGVHSKTDIRNVLEKY